MDNKPLIYFCALTNNGKIESPLLFADFNNAINLPFTSAYQIKLKGYEGSVIRTIWYDFAQEDYIYNEFDLQYLNTIIHEESYLDFLYILDYGLLIWVVNRDISYLINNIKKGLIDNFTIIDNNKEWFIKKNNLQAEYNKNRNNMEYRLQLWKSFIMNFTKQYCYRYSILYDVFSPNDNTWNKSKKDYVIPQYYYIDQLLFDGTHNKLHDDSLLKYHQAGKPKKLAIKWHIGKSEYSAYFWFEEEPIREVFDKFYGAHPNTKTDFIIRIDAENRKYELALYRYGLKEPQIIPENVYQLLVFKNKFEDYRSNNYNQERGAWIW